MPRKIPTELQEIEEQLQGTHYLLSGCLETSMSGSRGVELKIDLPSTEKAKGGRTFLYSKY